MSVPEYQKKANKKWIDKNYEQIAIRYPKGTKEIWKRAAEKRGLSLAQMVFQAVTEYINKGDTV